MTACWRQPLILTLEDKRGEPMGIINCKDARSRSSGKGTLLKSGEALPEVLRLLCSSPFSYLYRLSCNYARIIPTTTA